MIMVDSTETDIVEGVETSGGRSPIIRWRTHTTIGIMVHTMPPATATVP
jgi:hypothetical protein